MEQTSVVMGRFCALMWKGLEICNQFSYSIKRDMEIPLYVEFVSS